MIVGVVAVLLRDAWDVRLCRYVSKHPLYYLLGGPWGTFLEFLLLGQLVMLRAMRDVTWKGRDASARSVGDVDFFGFHSGFRKAVPRVPEFTGAL